VSSSGEITRLLAEIRGGNDQAQSQLIPLVYQELRRLARQYMRRERPSHTLQPTALVHEAYLRLMGQQSGVQWENRTHFFAVAARVMRRVLVDHARAHRAEKRGGEEPKLAVDDAPVFSGLTRAELLDLDQALERLAERDPRQAHIVELRFFGGLSESETAELLEISTRTVKRDWSLARAWLYREISEGPATTKQATSTQPPGKDGG